MLRLKNFFQWRFKVLWIFLLIHVCLIQLNAQGLQFNSNDSILPKRTSLNVFNSKPVEFKDHLYIDFDLSIWDISNLGYICNLAEKTNSYSLSYIYINGTGFLNFNIDSKSNKLKIPLSSSLLKRKKWMKVKMDFNLITDELILVINNTIYHARKLGLVNKIAAQIFFGKNPLYTEVPRMAIRNLLVGDNSKKYFFPLNEWNGNDVHDSNGNLIGYVENPVWLIKESYFWKPVWNHSFKDVAGLNFDPLDQNIFIFSKDSLITYNAEERQITSTPYKNKIPVPMVLGKSIFNTKENKCYIYEMFDIPKGEPSIAALDMSNAEWQPIGKATWPHQLHHHNIFYDEQQNDFYLFGGYGAYSYHNTFLRYDIDSDKWDSSVFTGDTITPRFFSAIGPSDKPGEILLFGGYGNESGNQVVGGKQYYDLYRINLKNHSVKKVWEMHPDSGVFVPANNLILSKDKKFFYALCYPHEVAKTELTLYQFSIKDGSYKIVSAPIPVTSERIESDMNLFYNGETEEFFCTEQEFTDRHNSTIKIFSLEAPPLSRELYLQSLSPIKKSNNSLLYVSLGLVIVAATVTIIYRKKSNKKQIAPQLQGGQPEPMQQLPTVSVKEEELTIAQKSENTVYLLGDFLVYDKKERDITHLFSPKIKQLFILILLNSKNSEGISSKKISSILWPDKDSAKTKNIRGVTFNHLRNAISDIDGLELNFSGDNYCFKTDERFFCDYYVLFNLFKERKFDAVLLSENISLALRGNLLSQMHEPWLDEFKFNYEKQLIDALVPQLQTLYVENRLKLLFEISKLVLSIEPFNDEGLKYELIVLKKLKGSDYAKKIFDQFIEEYKRSIGTEYPLSFEKITSENPA